MARFSYALQPALDAARTGARDAAVAVARARSLLTTHADAMFALDVYARRVRASTVRQDGSRVTPALIDVDRCIAAVDGHRRRRCALADDARAHLATAQEISRRLERRKEALERHRARLEQVFRAATELRESAESDEANARTWDATRASAAPRAARLDGAA